ncbi:MAG: hypothetical protein J6R01_04640 [Alistipes sp.]|nr:hypothetical protein [Alistipes sp.]MBO7306741.1 hypothetical protein [Alistipes sp.]
MSINFAIECRHCGAHTIVESYASCHTMRNMSAENAMHIDTECAIRCPNCRSRLNTTEAEFRSQVKMVRKS